MTDASSKSSMVPSSAKYSEHKFKVDISRRHSAAYRSSLKQNIRVIELRKLELCGSTEIHY